MLVAATLVAAPALLAERDDDLVVRESRLLVLSPSVVPTGDESETTISLSHASCGPRVALSLHSADRP